MMDPLVNEVKIGNVGDWTCQLKGGPGDGIELSQQVPWPAIRVMEHASSHEYRRVSRNDENLVAVYRWQRRTR